VFIGQKPPTVTRKLCLCVRFRALFFSAEIADQNLPKHDGIDNLHRCEVPALHLPYGLQFACALVHRGHIAKTSCPNAKLTGKRRAWVVEMTSALF
jgi:hypothetical protein